jgi:LysR family nod box-dependent transcriptional activator
VPDDARRSLRQINLNVLPALRAILKHRNLTRAAAELNLTQSAVSNALKRLRDHFGDDLLVKDGRQMRLTDKARLLVDPLEAALGALQQVLTDEPFDPARSTRRFRVATADYVTAIAIPALAHRLAEEAPLASVQTLTARGRSASDLRVENIDLIVSPRPVIEAAIFDAPGVLKEFQMETVARDPYVCIGKAGDRALAKGLTAAAYLARPHASFWLDLEIHASVEHGFMLQQGVKRFDRVLTSDFNILPLIASSSDCLVLAPRSLARVATRDLPLQIVASPLAVPDIELVMVWNKRRERDPEHAWFRALLQRCISDATAQGSASPQVAKGHSRKTAR